MKVEILNKVYSPELRAFFTPKQIKEVPKTEYWQLRVRAGDVQLATENKPAKRKVQ